MPDATSLTWVRGREAARLAERDPFWAPVRRRHPEVDLVLLPDEPGARGSVTEPVAVPQVEDLEAFAEEVLAAARSAWTTYLAPEPGETVARWIPGPVAGSLRREVTLTRDGVDEVAAASALRVAAGDLRSSRWRVLQPPTGLPRVLAGRDAAAGRRELQLVHVPDRSRLVLRLRSEPVLPDPANDEGAGR